MQESVREIIELENPPSVADRLSQAENRRLPQFHSAAHFALIGRLSSALHPVAEGKAAFRYFGAGSGFGEIPFLSSFPKNSSMISKISAFE
jgi:hypothetical protein